MTQPTPPSVCPKCGAPRLPSGTTIASYACGSQVGMEAQGKDCLISSLRSQLQAADVLSPPEPEDEIARLTEENPPGWYECTPKGKFFSRVMWWTGKELRLGPGHDAYVAFEGTKFRGPLVHAALTTQPAAKGGANG